MVKPYNHQEESEKQWEEYKRKYPFTPKPTVPVPIQLQAIGCQNTITTQCSVMLFALMSDGTIRVTDDTRMFEGQWISVPMETLDGAQVEKT